MATQETYDMLKEDLRKLEEDVRKVYLLEEFEYGKQYKNRLLEIEKRLFNTAKEPTDGLTQKDEEIIADISNFESEIEAFLQKQEKVNKTNSILDGLISDIEKNIDVRSTKELWDAVSEANTEHEKNTNDVNEDYIFRKKICDIVLDILILSAQKNEPIDLNNACNFCSTEGLKQAIQDRLIEIAENQNNIKALNAAQRLQISNISNPEVWKLLTGKEQLNIVDIQNKMQEETTGLRFSEDTNASKIMALTATRKKESLSTRIIRLLHLKEKTKTTVYTYGDFNPKTKKWENVRVVEDTFPKKLSKRQGRRLLRIVINDVDSVKREDIDNLCATNIQSVVFGRVNSIGEECFIDNKTLTNVEVSNYVQEICAKAFENCEKLSSVSLGNKVKSIAAFAFAGCTELTQLLLPDSLESIGSYCFHGNKKLQYVFFGEELEKIENNAFGNCIALVDVSLPEKTKEIGEGAFRNCLNLFSAYLPGVKNLFLDCFDNCRALTDVNLGSNLQCISEGTFQHCIALKSITIPKSIKEIYKAFMYCTQLEDVSFQEGTGEIKIQIDGKTTNVEASKWDYKSSPVFYGCEKLKKQSRKKTVKDEDQKAKQSDYEEEK